MKKILCLLMALLLCAGAALAETEEAGAAPAPGEKLGFALLNELHAEGENVLISPLSLITALAMAAEGAQGDTLEALLSAMGAENPGDVAALVPEGVQGANAAFARPDAQIRAEYIAALEEIFGAAQFEMDEDAMAAINDWVAEQTNGLIENFLSEAPDPNADLILLNALAMDAEWALPFAPERTEEADFHAANGDVSVDMMRAEEDYLYIERDGAQLVCLPYADGKLEMWVALPSADGGMDMAALLSALSTDGLSALTAGAELTRVDLRLPKLDVSAGESLGEALCALGLELPFSDAAEFPGVSEDPMKISEVIQKVRVQIDEAGTRAAAATAVTLAKMSMVMPEDVVEMAVDRPFAFAVADSETGAVCFAGVVENPA